MTTRAQRTSDRRDAIVDAALALFANHGYRGTSIQAVARAVGVTDAGVLYHFTSKSDLLLAVLEHHDERWGAMVAQSRAGGTARELQRLREWGVEMERDTDLVALVVILSSEHLRDSTPTNAYFRERYRTVLSRFEETFAAAAREGLLSKHLDARQEAVALAAFLDGIRLQWFFTDGAVSMAEAVRTYMDGTLRRLQPAKTP